LSPSEFPQTLRQPGRRLKGARVLALEPRCETRPFTPSTEASEVALFQLDADNGLYHLMTAPTRPQAPTFVFVNALTGTTDHWEAVVAPALREAGFGTLSYNFRGQTDSPFTPGTALTPALIVGDIGAIVAGLKPQRPVLVGLSIGGLFAAQAILAGTAAAGLVFLNTLREIGPRIAWINDALPFIAAFGGVQLFMDVSLPLVVNQEFAARARPNFLKGGYQPMDPDHPHLNLMRHAPQADWAVDWSKLALPILNITGLQDRVFFEPEVVDRLYATLPDARREDWADCGHLVPLERPERLAGSLARFGAEIEGQA
jgi:3-oxoadipate enol-lactonase